MYRACIAVVDASRARLFTFQRTLTAQGLEEELVEQRDLVDLARRRRPSELFSDTGTASGRNGSIQYGLDDHRDEHMKRFDAELARAVVDEISTLLKSTGADRLIVCASPRMLGELRDAGGELRRGTLAIDEIPRDLVKLTVPQLRERLTEYGLLPAPPPRAALA